MNHALLRDVGDGVEADGQAEGVGLADDASHGTFGVLFGEVVAAKVVVVDVVGEHVPGGDQDGVLDGDDRLLFTEAGHESGVAGAEVGAFPGAAGGHGGGTEGATEPSVAVSAFTGTVDAGGLVVSWADPGPRREVGWGVEPGHVGAGLGDDDLGGGLLDPGDGHQVFNLVGERGASPPRSASRAPRWWRTARRYGSGADGTRTRDAHQSGPSGLGPGPGSWVASGLWPSRP